VNFASLAPPPRVTKFACKILPHLDMGWPWEGLEIDVSFYYRK